MIIKKPLSFSRIHVSHPRVLNVIHKVRAAVYSIYKIPGVPALVCQ